MLFRCNIIGMKNIEKPPAQRFFDQIKLLDIGTNWDAVEDIFNKKNDILNKFAEYIIIQIDEIGSEMGEVFASIKKEISLGVAPEEPNAGPELAIQHLKTSFLKELEHIGVVNNFRETSREQFDNGSWWTVCYAEITFYPPELKKYLQENKGIIPGKNPSDFYITKDGEDFRFNNLLIDNLGKDTDYYIVFDVVYTLLPKSGFVKYVDIGKEIKNRIKKTSNFSSGQMAKFIQTKLDKNNGFLHYAKKVNNALPGGKELIHIIKRKGVEFNNRKGG